MARIGNCQCPYCYCPFPGKPGIQVDNKYICWRCKPHFISEHQKSIKYG